MANMSQRLKHGKALCGKVFAGFVETFNALVDFKDNLKGDDDVARGCGYISVDRTKKDRPIIRFNAEKLNLPEATENYPKRFDIRQKTTEEGEPVDGWFLFDNPYYSVGGKTYIFEGAEISSASNCIIALRLRADSPSVSPEMWKYGNIYALQNAQSDTSYYIVPLYTINQGKIALDWRVGPDFSMGEF